MNWKPSASLDVLQQRAQVLSQLRRFFEDREVLEVDVPLLSAFTTVDPHIQSWMVEADQHPLYLQTSPEFFLKRFLAAYPADVYYLGKAFRRESSSPRHQPEFTMLEWYRCGWDDRQLIQEVFDLILSLAPDTTQTIYHYDDLFESIIGLNPHIADTQALYEIAKTRFDCSFADDNSSREDRNCWLDLLFTHAIEPLLPEGLVAIVDYPVSQAALARLHQNGQGQTVARRFEVYWDGLELANGYWELADADEQEKRFKVDVEYRQKQNLPNYPYDQLLVDALRQGQLPGCAGVALGVDRLIMKCLKKESINEVLSFITE